MECSETREVCKMLQQRRGVQSFPLIASKWTPAGWPDRLFSHPSFGLALLEFKGMYTVVTPLQARRHKELMSCCICRFNQDWTQVRLEDAERCTEWFDALAMPEAILVARELGLMRTT